MSATMNNVRPIHAAAACLGPTRARGLIALVMAAAAVTSFAVSAHAGTADPALVRLLRAMAAIKLLFVAAAGAALYWRLGGPVGGARLAAYGAAGAAMAAGPGLIWKMGHIAAGAALLHGGLLVMILLLWRDPGMTDLLHAALAKARARRAANP